MIGATAHRHRHAGKKPVPLGGPSLALTRWRHPVTAQDLPHPAGTRELRVGRGGGINAPP